MRVTCFLNVITYLENSGNMLLILLKTLVQLESLEILFGIFAINNYV